jgi:hypothetical protein
MRRRQLHHDRGRCATAPFTLRIHFTATVFEKAFEKKLSPGLTWFVVRTSQAEMQPFLPWNVDLLLSSPVGW